MRGVKVSRGDVDGESPCEVKFKCVACSHVCWWGYLRVIIVWVVFVSGVVGCGDLGRSCGCSVPSASVKRGTGIAVPGTCGRANRSKDEVAVWAASQLVACNYGFRYAAVRGVCFA